MTETNNITETTNAAARDDKSIVLTAAEWEKIQSDQDYLHSIVFAVTEKSMKDVYHETQLTPDEVQTLFLDVQTNDEVGDAEQTTIAFVNGLKARKRSIDYANKNRSNRVVADSQARYNRWAEAHEKLAANPLTNLPIQLSYGLISEKLYTSLMAIAKQELDKAKSATAASL